MVAAIATVVGPDVEMRVSRPVMPRFAGSSVTAGAGNCTLFHASATVGTAGVGGTGGLPVVPSTNAMHTYVSSTICPAESVPMKWYSNPNAPGPPPGTWQSPLTLPVCAATSSTDHVMSYCTSGREPPVPPCPLFPTPGASTAIPTVVWPLSATSPPAS